MVRTDSNQCDILPFWLLCGVSNMTRGYDGKEMRLSEKSYLFGKQEAYKRCKEKYTQLILRYSLLSFILGCFMGLAL